MHFSMSQFNLMHLCTMTTHMEDVSPIDNKPLTNCLEEVTASVTKLAGCVCVCVFHEVIFHDKRLSIASRCYSIQTDEPLPNLLMEKVQCTLDGFCCYFIISVRFLTVSANKCETKGNMMSSTKVSRVYKKGYIQHLGLSCSLKGWVVEWPSCKGWLLFG